MLQKKSIFIFLLIAAMLLCGTSIAAQTSAGVPSPMHEYSSLEELRDAAPDMTLAYVPDGAVDITYHTIDGSFLAAQIEFTLDGHSYTYRAAAAKDEKTADHQDESLGGIYIDFDEDVDEEDVKEGDKIPFAVPESFSFEFEIEYNKKTAEVYMEWYLPEVKTQYTLFSTTAGMPDMPLITVAELMQPGLETAK